MTTREKQIQKLQDCRQDINWTYPEMVSFLMSLGFTHREGKGSHQHFLRPPHRITIAAHGKRLKRATVQDVREWFAQAGGK